MVVDRLRILVVSGTGAHSALHETHLKECGYDVIFTKTAGDFLDRVKNHGPFDMLVIDLDLPDIYVPRIMKSLQDLNCTAPILAIAGHSSLQAVIEAMHHGTSHYLIKPFSSEKLAQAVHCILSKDFILPEEIAGMPPHLGSLSDQIDTQNSKAAFGGFIGTSPAIQAVYEMIENAAGSEANVFITGESGTGKELCAEAIHKLSPRNETSFTPVNCASLQDNLDTFMTAEQGTLFLDEISELSPEMQAGFLNLLQSNVFQKAGTRIVCATNHDPQDEIRKGALREDLYYRLHVIHIHMPPLRMRATDITDLAHAFLHDYAAQEDKAFQEFSAGAEKTFLSYRWPGNVRELQNVIRNITVMHDGKTVSEDMLPPHIVSGERNHALITAPHAASEQNNRLVRPLWQVEKETIEGAIDRCGGNIPRAAALLEIAPSTIYRKKLAWEKAARQAKR